MLIYSSSFKCSRIVDLAKVLRCSIFIKPTSIHFLCTQCMFTLEKSHRIGNKNLNLNFGSQFELGIQTNVATDFRKSLVYSNKLIIFILYSFFQSAKNDLIQLNQALQDIPPLQHMITARQQF